VLRFKPFDPPQADLRAVTQKEEKIRQEIAQRREIQPRIGIGPKSFFKDGF